MSNLLRCLAILAAVVLAALLLTPTSHASASPLPQNGSPENALLEAANHSRAAAGLPALQWDAALAAAARQHAQRMVQQNTLSHQFPGELPLQERAKQTGARFSLIAENVAEGPIVLGLHTQWMNSAPHRANLLDHELNAVGIAVVQSGNLFFAVEDFSAAVAMLGSGCAGTASQFAIGGARFAAAEHQPMLRAKPARWIAAGRDKGR